MNAPNVPEFNAMTKVRLIQWIESVNLNGERLDSLRRTKLSRLTKNRLVTIAQDQARRALATAEAPAAQVGAETLSPNELRRDGSWLDTNGMSVAAEYSSWLADAIEDTGHVMWEDGEPWTTDGMDPFTRYIPTSPGFSTDAIDDNGDFVTVHLFDETYATREDALTEWKRRRMDITGRFPCWGDGGESIYAMGPDALAVLEVGGDDGEVTDVRAGWTARELIPADELFLYYDLRDDAQ